MLSIYEHKYLMPIDHDLMDYNKILIMNENHKARYYLQQWYVCLKKSSARLSSEGK